MNRLLLLAALVACGHPAPPPPPPSPAVPATPKDLDTAYNAKRYGECAQIAVQLAAQSKTQRATWLYNEACCEALAGTPEVAFATLDRALAAGLRGGGELEKDPDLAALHTDARWPSFVAKLAAADAAFLASIAEPKLRDELHALVATDQSARKAMIGAQNDPAALARVKDSDVVSTARMHEIVATHGWPGTKLVGADGAHDAWLLVQHADQDVAFQKQCLALMQAMGADVSATDIAYLEDRVAVAENRPQTYGTQFGPDHQPRPMVDPEHVDARRKTVGLGTMAEYREQMRAMYGHSFEK
jgi:hypothetical protein